MTKHTWSDLPDQLKIRVENLSLSKSDKNKLKKEIVSLRNSGKLSGRDLWLAKGINIPAKRLKLLNKIKEGKKAESKTTKVKSTTKVVTKTTKTKSAKDISLTGDQMGKLRTNVAPSKVDTLRKAVIKKLDSGDWKKRDIYSAKLTDLKEKLGVISKEKKTKERVTKVKKKAEKKPASGSTVKAKTTTKKVATKSGDITFTEKVAAKLKRGIKPEKVDTYFGKLKAALAKGDIQKRDLYKPKVIAKYKSDSYISKKAKVEKAVAKIKATTKAPAEIKAPAKTKTTQRKLPDGLKAMPNKAESLKILKKAGLTKDTITGKWQEGGLAFAKGYISKAVEAGELTQADVQAIAKKARGSHKSYKKQQAAIAKEYHKRKKEPSVRSSASSRKSTTSKKKTTTGKYDHIADTPSRVISESKADRKLEEIEKLTSAQVKSKLTEYGIDLSEPKTKLTMDELIINERIAMKEQGIRGSAQKRALQDLLIMLELESKK